MSKYDDALKLARNYYPDNKFLDTIFPELKPERKFKGGDYISYKGVIYYIRLSYWEGAYCVRQVSDLEHPTNILTIPCAFESKMTLLPDFEEIISTWGDGHNRTLVAKINHAWYKNRKGFKGILQALYTRDIDEITDSDAFKYQDWLKTPEYEFGCRQHNWIPYNNMALLDMKANWEKYASDYLNKIADDCDLKCILAFLHYPDLPIYKD